MSTHISLTQELKSVEHRVLARLRELAPLVAEHQELVKIAQRLGLDVEAAGVAQPEPSRRRSSTPRANAGGQRGPAAKASTEGRAAPGDDGSVREQQLLGVVQARPGLTVAQVAEQLGVNATSLYPVVRKLTEERVLVKRGRMLHPRT